MLLCTSTVGSRMGSPSAWSHIFEFEWPWQVPSRSRALIFETVMSRKVVEVGHVLLLNAIMLSPATQADLRLSDSDFVGVCVNIGEQICCVLSEEMSFEVFSPIWSHVNKNKKKIVKNKKKCKILRNKTKMIWRYFDKVPFHQIWHWSAGRVLRKRVLRTDAGCPLDDSSSAVQ